MLLFVFTQLLQNYHDKVMLEEGLYPYLPTNIKVFVVYMTEFVGLYGMNLDPLRPRPGKS
jgi:hypothetical protein